MPLNYLDVQIVSRSQGHSAVAKAAYASGEPLTDRRLMKRFDYRYKTLDHLQHAEILAPDGAPAWVQDRGSLWNKAEEAERYKTAQVARRVVAALPRELTFAQNLALLREFVAEQFTSQGMIADLAMHESPASDGKPNPHFHLLLTMRTLDGDRFARTKTAARGWNDKGNVGRWRAAWEEAVNRHLAAAGSEAVLRMGSYESRGVNKEPQEHLGYAATALERRNIRTAAGDRNRAVRWRNALAAYAAAQQIEAEDPPGNPAPSPAASRWLAGFSQVIGGYRRSFTETALRVARAVDRAADSVMDRFARRQRGRGYER